MIESNNELKTFIYKASHDIRGPLATFIGLSNVGSIRAKDEELRFCLNKIIETGSRLGETLKNLLKIMALKEDEVAYAPIDSYEIGNAIAKMLKDYEDEKLQFQIDVSSSIDFNTDNALLIAIIKSLIDNAVNYSDYRKDSPRVKIIIYQAVDKELRIQIEDNGVGTDPKIEGKVFDLF